MSEKPSPKPAASKAPTKPVGNGSTKPPAPKGKADDDETFDFLASPQSPGELGRLAHYRVLKVLGKGGMGIVFMAEDTRLHRIVGLKVMLPAIAKKAIAKDRFLREARATAAIEHDHIITIYEVNEDRDVPYLAMQFLKGMTLEDWLKAGKTLNVPQIMRIGKEIAKGLAAAHARRLIHRDIKPSNIWLDAVNKGRVKILDFGLARPTNEETHLTQEGMILGSPAYMSPEQARGQEIDERVDLFSLGCVLYRLCSGKLPFTGKDAMSMLLAITNDEPPSLAKLNDDLPPALAELVHQLLAKKPEDRPASAKAVVQTIQNIERDWVANARTVAARPIRDTTAGADHDATIAADVEPALEESAITDLELPSADAPVRPPAPRGGSWIFAGLGCSLLSVVSILCCLGFFISTNKGTVQIAAEDDIARAWLEQNIVSVRDHNKHEYALKVGVPNPLPAGGYHIEAGDLPRDLVIQPTDFLLSRGETVDIRVAYVPPKSNRPELVLVTADQARKVQREWAAYLKRDIVETNSQGAKMVLIPPGEFMMGSSRDQLKQLGADFFKKLKKEGGAIDGYLARLPAEGPQHRVRISKPFYLGATEVTFGQFTKFVSGNNNYITEPQATGKGGTGIDDGKVAPRNGKFTWLQPGYSPITGPPGTGSPVNNITWQDAEEFCKWLSKKEKRTYRLPTEAEWEYACRAGTTTLWHFGDDLARESNAREYMWYSVGFFNKLNPFTPKEVGKKRTNDFGLHDMHGNVSEMCADYWNSTFYGRKLKDGIAIDPLAPAPIPDAKRVLRGGSFHEMGFIARSACRTPIEPDLGFVHVGFRVVCEAPLPAD